MRLYLLIVLTIIASLTVFAAVPPMISYQGKLTKADGTLLPDGTYRMEFSIYDVPTDGRAIWWETNPAVQVKKGLFSVLLGSVVNLPGNIFDSQNRYFGVKVGDDPEMTPRQQIASVPFALKAGVADKAIVADTVVDGSITKAKLASDVTSATIDAIATGWIPVNETWTYYYVGGGDNQITIPDGASLKYAVGDKVRFKQGGLYKYFYVTGVSDATHVMNLTGGSDYTLTNTPITNASYSKFSSPVGFPEWFNNNQISLTPDSGTLAITGREYERFKLNGHETHVQFCIIFSLTNPVNNVTIDMPNIYGPDTRQLGSAYSIAYGAPYTNFIATKIVRASRNQLFTEVGWPSGNYQFLAADLLFKNNL